MNVGYATLFFASSPNTVHVYSYEPFPETFKEATGNLGLNPHIKSKMTPHNYGISDQSKQVEVPMLESGSAVASTSKIFVEHNKVVSDKNIKVEVRSITDVLQEITVKHPQERIFLKVDCEGEEYGIMECLNHSELLKKIDGFFIEWHIKGPAPIIAILNDNNFTALHLPRVGVDSGMIYAFKS
jgi:FkbM family methyltransferase